MFDGRAATSAAAAMEARPLPTPPPVTSPTSATSTSKRPNPLEDLIYTESLYVEDLGVIIKVSDTGGSKRALRGLVANSMYYYSASLVLGRAPTSLRQRSTRCFARWKRCTASTSSC